MIVDALCAVASAVPSGVPGPNALRAAYTTADCPEGSARYRTFDLTAIPPQRK